MTSRQRYPQGGGRGSDRPLRVGENLRRTLGELLCRHSFGEPVLESTPVTVSEVVMSPDLAHARVCVTAMGQDETEILAALRRIAPRLRGLLGRELHLRTAPALAFLPDRRFGLAARTDSIIRMTGQGAPPGGEDDRED